MMLTAARARNTEAAPGRSSSECSAGAAEALAALKSYMTCHWMDLLHRGTDDTPD